MLKSEHFKCYCLTIFAAKTEINQHSMNTRGFFCVFLINTTNIFTRLPGCVLIFMYVIKMLFMKKLHLALERYVAIKFVNIIILMLILF